MGSKLIALAATIVLFQLSTNAEALNPQVQPIAQLAENVLPASYETPPADCPVVLSEVDRRGLCDSGIEPRCLPNPNRNQFQPYSELALLVLSTNVDTDISDGSFDNQILSAGRQATTSCFICGCRPREIEQCRYYAGSARTYRDGERGADHGKRMIKSSDGNSTANIIEALGCVQQWIGESEAYVRSDGRGHRVRYVYDSSDRQWHVAKVHEKNGNNFDSMILERFFRVAEEQQGLPSGALKNSRTPVTFVMDDQCRPVNDASESEICGSFLVSAITSPISLAWDQANSFGKDVSVVRFPLDPTQAGKVYTWKASAAAPLLVYDPAHSGTITSAAQLFGNWTFYAGEQHASSSSKIRSKHAPWADGFAALATLDRNGDGRIAGEELKDLALWFDHNQDGVSQSGEVQPLSSLGVESLFYKGGVVNPDTNDITVEIGFERRLSDGRVVRGAAIDWFADEAESEQVLLHRLQALAGEQAPTGLPATPEGTAPLGSASTTEGVYDSLIGLWNWELTSFTRTQQAAPAVAESHGGTLAFFRAPNGEFRGVSVLESVDSKRNAKLLTYVPLSNFSIESGHKRRLQFESTTSSGVAVKHSVELSPEALSGRSVIRYQGSSTVGYSWKAVRS